MRTIEGGEGAGRGLRTSHLNFGRYAIVGWPKRRARGEAFDAGSDPMILPRGSER